jgi:WD40 repeat protein
VTAGYDRSARIWDTHTGRQVAILRGHEDSHGVVTMSDARFSRDGERIVTTASDGTARLWDAASGQEIAALQPSRGTQVAFSRLGTLLITHADKAATVWDLRWGVVMRGPTLVEHVLKEKLAGAYNFTRDDEDDTGLDGIEGTLQVL